MVSILLHVLRHAYRGIVFAFVLAHIPFLSAHAIAQGTFDFETNISGAFSSTMTHTINGTQLTFRATLSGTNSAVATQNGATNHASADTAIFEFDRAINITNLKLIAIAGGFDVIYTPTGGSNSQVTAPSMVGSQTVPINWTEVTGFTLTIPSIASFSGAAIQTDDIVFTLPTPSDTTAPTVTSIARQTPSNQATTADSLVYRVTFSEGVANVDATDFNASGSTGDATSVSTVNSSTYDVTVSGGDLANLNGTVSLGFAGGQNIADTAGNALTNTNPDSTQSYTLDNTAPTVTSIARQTPSNEATNADSLRYRVTFSEDVENVDPTDFAVSGTTGVANGTSKISSGTYDVFVSGGDLANLNGTVSLSFAGGQNITDAAGNALTNTTPGSTQSYTLDNTAPTVTSVARQTPSNQATNVDSLVYRVTFSEGVANVDTTDFNASGTTGDATSVSTINSSTYDVTVSGGDLANLNGTVSLSFAGGQNIEDTTGNALTNTTPGSTQSYTLDNTAPSLDSFSRQTPANQTTDSDTLVFSIGFSETVSNVSADDFTITGTTATGALAVVSGSSYTLTLSGGNLAALDGTVGLNLAGAQNIADSAGNDLPSGEPSTDETYTLDNTNFPPALGGTPADGSATEDVSTAIDLSAYNISDADGDTLTITLAVNRGTIASTDGNGLTGGVTVANSGSASMTLTGSVANLNTYLNSTSKIVYQTASNDTTTAVLTVTPNDGAENGTADTLNISITAVNDNPTVSGLPSSVTVTEDTQGNVNLGAASFTDVDSSPITVTLTASAGSFATPVSGGSVTGTGVSATVVTLEGSAANINTYLDTASNIKYTGASNATGNAIATITVTANDGDGSNTVNFGTVNINITAVNDFPTVTGLPSSVTVTEDAQGNVDLSAASFADVDSSPITVTLTASDGSFAIPVDGGANVTETRVSATVITLVGTPANIDTYLDTASNIKYTGPSAVSGNAAETITVTANDGDGSNDVSLGTVNINITPLPRPEIEITSSETGAVSDGGSDAQGNEPVGAAKTLTYTITNTGTDTLNLTDNAPTLSNDSNVTSPSAGNYSSKTLVAGTGSATFTVTYTPSAVGAFSFEIDVKSDDADEGVYDITVSGTGVDGDAPILNNFTRQTPSDELTGANRLVFAIGFSEGVTNVTADDFTITGTTATGVLAGSGSSYTLTVSGGDLSDLNATVGLDLDSGQDIEDLAGNALPAGEPASDETYQVSNDVTAPGVTISATIPQPVSGAFPITITFTEDVFNFDETDLSVTNASVSDFSGSGASYTATITPTSNVDITIDIAADVAIDASGNGNLAADQFSVSYDQSAPALKAFTRQTPSDEITDEDSLVFAIGFSEDVTNVTEDDFTITGTTATGVLAGSGSSYTLTVSGGDLSDLNATVGLDLAQGQDIEDLAGYALPAGEPASDETYQVSNDVTAPGVTIVLPGETADGPFTARFEFSEEVKGFAIDDIVLTNADSSSFSEVEDTVYTALITPQTIGALTLNIPAGAVQDMAGNQNSAVNAELEVRVPDDDVIIPVDATDVDITTVNKTVTITNPGTAPLSFTATVDVPWADVSPSSGTLPSSGDLDFIISLNDQADKLAPGDYTGKVTIRRETAASSISNAQANETNNVSTILIEIPLIVKIEKRFGSLQIVSSTPGGSLNDATFRYTSTDEDLDGLELTTASGTANSATFEKTAGQYDMVQTLPEGWTVERISCAGDLDGGSQIDLESASINIDLDVGETLVCTFSNKRNEDAIRLATLRSIRGFMVRRADRLISAAPDLSRRFDERGRIDRGTFGADIDGSGRYQMAFAGSLSGLRNSAAAQAPTIAGVTNYERDFMQGWDVWVATQMSGVKDNRAGEDTSSDFGIAQLGIDVQTSHNLILGVLTQYDWAQESSNDIFEAAGGIRGARVEGEGWMIGPYAVWRIKDSLIFDGLFMSGQSDNRVDPLGFYEDDFETDRFMIRANLTGSLESGSWRLRPQAGLTHYEETQSGYVDSLGITIPEQTIAIGRFRAGPEIAWVYHGQQGNLIELSTTLNAVWDYQNPGLYNESGALTSQGDKLRADASFSLKSYTARGVRIGFDVGFAGLNTSAFEASTARFQISIPFGAGTGSGGATGSSGFGLNSGLSTGLGQHSDNPFGEFNFQNDLGFLHNYGLAGSSNF